MRKVLENEFYYLENFHRVLEWIARRYGDLLSDDEQAFIGGFPALPRPSRALFVRMVMRKGTHFRASKLNYPEIGCPVDAARHLLPTGWIVDDPVLALDELFELLLKPEICAAFQLAPHEKNARKADQREALRTRCGDARPFSRWYGDSGDRVYGILVKPLCDRLRLIFFGNLRQDWTEFVLSDLGVFRFEQVAFSPSSRAFRTRRDVDDYLALHGCKERFRAGEPLADVLAALPAEPFDNAWLDGRRQKLMFEVAQHVEKQQDWTGAFALYARCDYPGARGRAIRVLEKDGQFGPAHALLERARQAPESEAEHQLLLRIGARLHRKLGLEQQAAQRKPDVARLDLRLPMPPAQDAWWVEGVVRDHLAREEAPVFYVENTLINALFGLLCWNAIFCPIPGAFFHPFHRGPADLMSADFHRRREDQFRACLDQLDQHDQLEGADARDTASYRDTIRANYRDKHGIQSPFVSWGALSFELVEMALACIPAAHLKKWCERILVDIKSNSSGFPDLIQFWPVERRYNMIEVKGPGDRLQDNQLRWIAYCAAHGMPVSVCYLQWTEPRA